MRRGPALAVLALWAVATLPFTDKAFHIDDTAYLAIARQMAADPLRPYSFEFHWHEAPAPAFRLYHPPLIPGFLAAVSALDGGRQREPVLHLAMSLFTALAALCAWRLGERFGVPPAVLAAATVLSPIILPAINVMLDVPVLALFLAAVVLHVDGVDRGSPLRLSAAGALAGLAILAKYNAALIVPVLAAYSVSKRHWRSLLYLAIPFAVLGAWCAHNLIVYGDLHLLAQVGTADRPPRRLIRNALAGVSVLGAAWLFAPYARLRGPTGIVAACAAVAAGLACGARADRDRWEAALIFANGFLLAAVALAALAASIRGVRGGGEEAARAMDRFFLLTWAAGVLLFAWLFPPFQAPRHYFCALPPLAILAFEGVRPRALAIAAAPSAALALAVAAADLETAGAYRSAAAEFAAEARAGGRRAFYVGHWGWQHYAEREGMPRLPVRPGDLRSGDLVFVPRDVDQEPIAPPVRDRLRVRRLVEEPRRIPIRTQMDRGGLYSISHRDVPYGATRRPVVDVFTVFEVR